jgi:hypothetical protein
MNSDFHAVEFMRRRRAEIEKEDEGLTWEQRSEKTLRLLANNPRWLRLRRRLAKPNRSTAPLHVADR